MSVIRRIGDWTGDGLSEMAVYMDTSEGKVDVFSSEKQSGALTEKNDTVGDISGNSADTNGNFGYGIALVFVDPQNLHAFAEKFAGEHKIGLPFVVDPDGKLAAAVRADKEVGVGLKIDHTPTIWIVSNKKSGKPYIEVTDTNQLYIMIDAMKKE